MWSLSEKQQSISKTIKNFIRIYTEFRYKHFWRHSKEETLTFGKCRSIILKGIFLYIQLTKQFSCSLSITHHLLSFHSSATWLRISRLKHPVYIVFIYSIHFSIIQYQPYGWGTLGKSSSILLEKTTHQWVIIWNGKGKKLVS